jgi:hypothetical protein
MGVEPNDSVDVADLTESDIALVRSLIDCLRSKNKQIKN